MYTDSGLNANSHYKLQARIPQILFVCSSLSCVKETSPLAIYPTGVAPETSDSCALCQYYQLPFLELI